MNLNKYRLPDSVRHGVEIELPDSEGAKFLVKLPSGANRQWQREMLRRMAASGVKVNAQGEIERDAPGAAEAMIKWEEGRLEKFLEVCVVSGPEDFDLQSLADEYRPALVKLFKMAEELADAESSEAEAVGEASAP